MDIDISVAGSPVRAYLALPAGGQGPGVLVLHAWWGLKPFFKELCDRLAGCGFVALAPDLYHGPTAATVAEAQALIDAADPQQVGATVVAAREHLWSLPARTGGRIGVLGFSMGGAWALVTAAAAPQQVGAAAVFYGVYPVDFSRMQAKFIGHYSDVDAWEPLEGIRAMEQEMRSSGVDAVFHIYPGRAHWFFESDRPEFDPQAAALAWERTAAFFRESLQPGRPG
jgi:carboxymethylenebutenolidase